MPDVYTETLKRAAAILGCDDALASRLKVAPEQLALWLHGSEQPPLATFLQAVDIVMAHAPSKLTPPKA